VRVAARDQILRADGAIEFKLHTGELDLTTVTVVAEGFIELFFSRRGIAFGISWNH
jgi:hypothetical protein